MIILEIVSCHIYFAPRRDAKYCDQRLCMFILCVCLSVRLYVSKTTVQISRNFLYVLPWPCLGPPLTAMRHVISGFVGDITFPYNGGNRPESKKTSIFVQFVMRRHQSDVRQRLLVEIARWQHRRRSLPSPTAYCFVLYRCLH